jgi:hypothetical protein
MTDEVMESNSFDMKFRRFEERGALERGSKVLSVDLPCPGSSVVAKEPNGEVGVD